MKHHLIFKDEKSDKFWQIEVSGKSFTVTYGKTGATGKSQTKVFESDDQCRGEADKLLQEKLKKGYTKEADDRNTSIGESGKTKASTDEYFKNWQSIAAASDLQNALVNHFSYLLDTPGVEKQVTLILQEVMSRADEVTCDKQAMTIRFSKFNVIANAPSNLTKTHYPDSFQNLLRHHKTIVISNYWNQLGEEVGFSTDDGWFDDMEEVTDPILLQFSKSAKHLISPISDGSSGNYWLYHPSEKNLSGEPTIYYLEHDGMEIKDAQPFNAGTLFLIQLAELLGIPARQLINDNPEGWWNSLDLEWKKLLAGYGIVKETQVAKALSLVELSIGSDSGIRNLEPLRLMLQLEKLSIHAPLIQEISALTSLAMLTDLTISCKKVQDISPLKRLVKLHTLNLSTSGVTSIEPLSAIFVKSLKLNYTRFKDAAQLAELNYHHVHHLELSHTDVEDLSPIHRFKNIKILDISNTRVKSLDFLSEWTLDKVVLDNTSVTILGPLDSHLLSYVSFSNTPVSEDEAVRFKATTSWWCQIRSGFDLQESFVVKTKKDVPSDELFNKIVSEWVERLLHQISQGRWNLGGAYENENELWSAAEDEKQAKNLIDKYQLDKESNVEAWLEKLQSIIKQLESKKNLMRSVLASHWIQSFKLLASISNDKFLQCVEVRFSNSLRAAKHQMDNDAKRLVKVYLEVFPLLLSAAPGVYAKGVDIRQTTLANALLICFKDEKVLDRLQALIPTVVTEPSLAASLAEFYLARNEIKKFIEFVKWAIYLGCDKDSLIDNPSFGSYKNTPDFLAAINSDKYEDQFKKACDSFDTEKLLLLIFDLKLFKGKAQIETFISQVYNVYNTLIANNKLQDAKRLITGYVAVLPEIGDANQVAAGLVTGSSFKLKEAFASNTILLAIITKDDDVLSLATQLMPDPVTYDRLAFNLACLYAIKREKEKMLRYTQRALDLGKKSEEFLGDQDFDFYKSDPQFLAVLGMRPL